MAAIVRSVAKWRGGDATARPYRPGALLAYRLREAWRLGCTLAHSETAEDTLEAPNPSLHNMHRVGFETLYDKEFWGPAPAA